MAEPSGRVWLLTKEPAGAEGMSPGARVGWMRDSVREAGWALDVVHCASTKPVDFDRFLSAWKPGEPVVLDPYVPGPVLVRLLGSRIPFDADYYCVSLPEVAELFPAREAGWVRRERLRRSRKYGWVAKAARRLYVSDHQQAVVLSSIVAAGPDNRLATLAGKLPGRCVELPLGVPPASPGPWDNPYPPALRARPVVLWGGGIWPWFDMETLLRAFERMPDREAGPCLFFLAGTNHRPDPAADEPVRKVRERASALGILGRNVFFNERRIEPPEVPAYLAHATAGALANPPSWEALVSWRTRYLDLIAQGVPLLFAGSDPLGDRMARAGAARQVDAGDSEGLCREILLVAGDSRLRAGMSAASSELRQELSRWALGKRWVDSLRTGGWEPRAPAAPSLLELLAYRAGR